MTILVIIETELITVVNNDIVKERSALVRERCLFFIGSA
jgi:hypothetical protein